MRDHKRQFILGNEAETEESDVEDDGDSGFSPSPDKEAGDVTDSSQLSSSPGSQPPNNLDIPRMTSRHNVISRKDNLMLSPEGLDTMHGETETDHAPTNLSPSKSNKYIIYMTSSELN